MPSGTAPPANSSQPAVARHTNRLISTARQPSSRSRPQSSACRVLSSAPPPTICRPRGVRPQVKAAASGDGHDLPPTQRSMPQAKNHNSDKTQQASKVSDLDRQAPALAIGIENEMILRPKKQKEYPVQVEVFLQHLAEIHNRSVGRRGPKMFSSPLISLTDFPKKTSTFQEWELVEEPTLMVYADNPGRYSVELKSPKFRLSDEPRWKDHVRAAWFSLQKECSIQKNRSCSTHVHVSICNGEMEAMGLNLQSMTKIAQCAIHFEPALEALVPLDRRGNQYVLSNWIDNSCFAEKSWTREAVIQMIGRSPSIRHLREIMCPKPPYRYYAWNFHAHAKFGTVEFRKGSASVNAEQAILWADLAILFVQAALNVDIEQLNEVPANVGALKSFLGKDNLACLAPLLRGTSDSDCVQPTRTLNRSKEEVAILNEKLNDDARKQQALAQKSAGQGPA